jgi:endoglycosylceramidase
MPSPGVVNMTYLDQVADLITKLAANNIYTIVDAHQDVLSPFMCGEGIPNWAFELAMETVGFNTSDPKKAFPAPQNFTLARNPDGTPVLSDCQKYEFFSFYTTYQNEAAFNALYHYSAVIDAFAQSWAAVAARLKSVPGIIGYELLNEPWPAGKHPFSDNDALMVLYTTLANSIRAHDNRTIIMFEPIVIDSYLSVINRTTTFPVGGIEGLEHADRQIYAYHLYCVNNSTGAPEPWLFCKYLVQDMWSMIKRDLKLLQLGGFLTEFGAVGNDGDSIKLLHEHASFADSFFQSWTYWTFKGFDDITTQNAATESFFNTDGSLQTAKVTALARTYAQTISGQPASMSFDPSSRVLYLYLIFT